VAQLGSVVQLDVRTLKMKLLQPHTMCLRVIPADHIA
jgi:hypothetical protein